MELADKTSAILSPSTKETVDVEVEEDVLLAPDWATIYRQLTAQDRGDIQFSVKELSSGMANPTQRHWGMLVRLGQYLKNRPRYLIKFDYQSRGFILNVFSDADWAGHLRTRKSTSGGIPCLGDHALRSWASTQNVIALSSGESESYGLVKATSIALGIKTTIADLGVKVRIRILVDASAGQAIASRRGLSKMGNREVATLWVQEDVKSRELVLVKIKHDSTRPTYLLSI